MLSPTAPGFGPEPRAAPDPLAYGTSRWLEPMAPAAGSSPGLLAGWLVPAPFCLQTPSLAAPSLPPKLLPPQGLDALFSSELIRPRECQVPRAFADMRLPRWLSHADHSPCSEPACEACPAGLLPHFPSGSSPFLPCFLLLCRPLECPLSPVSIPALLLHH